MNKSMMTHLELVLMNIQLLLDQLGDEGTCKGCGKKIWWITYKSGKKAPITEEALNHFADCPQSRMTEERTVEVLAFISRIVAKRWLKASLKKLKIEKA